MCPRRFQALLLFGGHCDGKIDLHRNSSYPPRWVSGHLFCDVRFRSFEFHADSLGDDGHCCENACAQRGGEQVGWRKGLAFAEVIGRGIGQDLCAGWPVAGGAAKIAIV